MEVTDLLSSSVLSPGEIIMMVPVPAEGPGWGWDDLGDGMMSARLYRFMQRDIDQGRIYYRSSPKLVSAVSDDITFEVSWLVV